MPWVRRTRHLALSAADDDPLVVIRSLLTGTCVSLEPPELAALLALPIRSWRWREEGDPWAEELGRDGLLVSDDPHEPFPGLRRRDEELTALAWWPEAAALHLGSRWEDVQAEVPGRGGSRTLFEYPGAPLPALPVHGGPRTALPRSDETTALRRLLARRRTVRTFDDALQPVNIVELATLLRWVWGARGTLQLAGADVGLKRTSPSSGALHPIEVYPVVRRVEGLQSGLYHYLGGEHALEQVAALDEGSARALVEDGTVGQWYFADADVAFVMTARFWRVNRKYRRNEKIYRATLVDAGHLSQTFYLLCTELGLGPWVTMALNEVVLERALDLEPLDEGVIAVCGCGRPDTSGHSSFLQPSFVPLDPPEAST
jgi:putative peptide maturation dehydrogenase